MAIAASAKRRRSSQMFRPSSEENTAKLSYDNDVKVPDPRLSDGMPLPKYLREKFPKHLLGMPIIEIDKFYRHQKLVQGKCQNGSSLTSTCMSWRYLSGFFRGRTTHHYLKNEHWVTGTFVIVSSNWVIHRFSALESLWVLSPFNRLRWILVRIITHSVFELLMFTVVLSLAIVIPVSQLFEDKKAFFLPYYLIFTIEVVMKILAHGFFLKSFSYLRSPWNWMDLILTCVGWYTECFAQDGTLYGIQSLRVLRLIHFFTYPRLLFARMFRSLSLMKDLIVYGGFVFCVSTMFALIQYQGVFSQNCDPKNKTAISDPECVILGMQSEKCQNTSTRPRCPDGFVCLEDYGKKPRYCLTNFDNPFSAGLGIFRVISRDYWDHLFAEITSTSTPWNLIFFIIVIVFGRYLLTNFIVGYIAVSLNQFMDILAGKLPKNEGPLLVTNIQEFGNAADSSAANNEQAAVRKTPRSSMCRVRNDDILLNNLDVEGDRAVIDECGNDQEFYYSDNESYIGSVESEKSHSIHFTSLLVSWIDKFCIWQCCTCWTMLQKRLSAVVLSQYFSGFICLCIATNIVILTLDHHEMTKCFTVISYYSARIFTLIYLVEATLKILALSPKYYFTVSWNVFEFLIAIDCLLELTLEITGISGLAIMRSFRMFRVLRFARWWPGFGSLMKIVTTNSIVVFVVILLFATMGVFLFGNNYETSASLSVDGAYLRWHTIDFTHSLLFVVRILCGEWMDTLNTCILYNGWPCIPFFLAVVTIGNLVLFHLFITMLMAAIQSNNLCETQLDSQQNLFFIIRDSFLSMCSSRCSRKSSASNEIDKNDLDAPPEMEVAASCEDNTRTFILKVNTDTNVVEVESRTRHCCFRCMSCQASSNTPHSRKTCWHHWDAFREILHSTSTGRYFNIGMTTFIIISTIPLCMQGHGFNPGSLLSRITYINDVAVLIVFSLEFIANILSHGIKNYFNNNWLCFDFVITSLHMISLVTRTFELYHIPFIALRPLKLIPRIENLRVVAAALTYRASVLLDSVLACGIFWLVFCLTGMQLFARKFYRCIDTESRSLLTNDGLLEDDCISKNFTWANAKINFDNIQNSFIALLHVASLKGWIPILYSAIDTVEAPFRPLRNVTIHFGWFFILFLVFGVFCCFALILSAFVKRTNDHMQQLGGYAELLMTIGQKKRYANKLKTFFCAPAICMPDFKGRKIPFVVRLLNSRIFTLVIIATILASSAATVALYCPSQSNRIESLFGSLDLGFFLFFVLEVVLKLTVFGRQFFGEPWNIYDIVIIAISTLGYVCLVFGVVLFRTGLLSVLRFIRLIRWLKPVRRIASRIWALTPAIVNVGALLLILMIFYAIIAMTCFYEAQFFPDHEPYHNFKTFFPTMLILSEMSLGSGWDFIYSGLAEVDQRSAAAFVLSYLFLCYFIVTGFGVVLFLENYHFVEKKLRLNITDEDLDNFVATWQVFDPRASGFINFELLSHLLNSLNPRLQISRPNVEKIGALNVSVMEGNLVAFENVFEALLSFQSVESN